MLRHGQRIGGQQFKKGIAALAFLVVKGRQPLLQFRIRGFGFAHGALAREPHQGQCQAECRRRGKRDQQRQSRTR